MTTREPGYYRVIFTGEKMVAELSEDGIWFLTATHGNFCSDEFDWIDTTPIDLTPRMSAEEKLLRLISGPGYGDGRWLAVQIRNGKSFDELCAEYGIDTEVKR